MAAFGRGELSLEQVAEIVKAPAWAEAKLLDIALISTVSKLRRAMRSCMFDGDPDEPATEPAAPADRVSFGTTNGRRWRLTADLGLDEGRRVEAALTEPATRCSLPATRSLDAVESTLATRPLPHVDPPRRHRRRRDHDRRVAHPAVDRAAPGVRRRRPARVGTQRRALLRRPQPSDRARPHPPPRAASRSRLSGPGMRRRPVRRDPPHRPLARRRPDRHVEPGLACPRHHKLHHRGLLDISGNADEFDGITFTDATGHIVPGSGRAKPPTVDPRPTGRTLRTPTARPIRLELDRPRLGPRQRTRMPPPESTFAPRRLQWPLPARIK